MRQIRQALRLHLEAGLSYAQIARAVNIGKGTVGKFILLARAAGVDWAVAQTLTDEELETRLYRPAVPRASRQLEPDYAWIHQELKRPGVTLQLLWEEYQRAAELAYKYTSFCVKYRAWAAALKRSMRQTHVAGERLFVDYAGQTVPVIDAASGEIRRAQIFVAVLGASNYTYARATATQNSADWVGSIIGALEFIGGVPRLVVPDQTRALIARPDRYEPAVNRLVDEFCDHYDVALLPARPAHPRDKPKVEVAVQVVERWILARLRNRRFFSLAELNAAIAELTQVELRVTGTAVEIISGTQRVAVHAYSNQRGAHTTLAQHMPASHRAHREWTPQRLIDWGERIGAACGAVVRWQMEHRPHPEQGYRACLGLQRLARQFGDARLEAACARALSIRSPTYRSVNSILASGLDRQQLSNAPAQAALPLHENVRGPDYYH